MTRLALLGFPVDGALSPVLHRAAYAAMGLPWTYHAIECRSQDLPRFLGTLDDSWHGFSLTMTLKRTVVPVLDEASETVSRIGAANTIVVTPSGRLVGENTWWEGCRCSYTKPRDKSSCRRDTPRRRSPRCCWPVSPRSTRACGD
ncbi:shikimate dehydrogenase family protein [Streptomyces sp. NPDC007896]|uniref:shikimate dehydrogenase family protein n=1 Tax=Streptomyces sp. NPDC007896 TaxID=3364784 RepID=UPI0036E15CF8